MPRSRSISSAGIFLAAAAGLIAAASVLFFPVNPPDGGARPNALRFEVRAPAGGRIGAGYEFGAGYNAALCSFATLSKSPAPQEVSLPLPGGRIEVLRLFAPSPSVQAAVRDLRAEDFRGRVVRFEDGDLRADGRIALRHPLVLASVSRPHPGIVQREREIAALLLIAEAVVTVLLLCRSIMARHSRNQRETKLKASSTKTQVEAGSTGMAAVDAPSRRVPVVPAWTYYLTIGLSAAAIIFARRPSAFADPQFWAEDGPVYFLGRTLGWRGLFATQANYLAIVPRATALLAGLAPVWYAPLVYMVAAAATAILAVLKAASPRVGLPLAPIAALAVVLVPAMEEILPSVTNAQWLGAVVLALVAASEIPSTRWEAVRDSVLVAIFGFTGPYIVALAPVIAWRAFRAKSKTGWTAAIIALIAAAVQIAAYEGSHPARLPGSAPAASKILGAVGYRTGGQLFGMTPSPLFANPVPWGIAGLSVLVIIWAIFPLRGRRGDLRPLLAWTALTTIVGGLWRYATITGQFFEPVYIDRYFHEIVLFTLWILLAGLAARQARRWLAALFLAAIVACNAARFRLAPLADFDWPHYAGLIERGKAVTVPINPQDWFFDSPGR